MDGASFIDLQEALVYVFAPILIVLFGAIITGSILAALVNVFLDVAGHLFKS